MYFLKQLSGFIFRIFQLFEMTINLVSKQVIFNLILIQEPLDLR